MSTLNAINGEWFDYGTGKIPVLVRFHAVDRFDGFFIAIRNGVDKGYAYYGRDCKPVRRATEEKAAKVNEDLRTSPEGDHFNKTIDLMFGFATMGSERPLSLRKKVKEIKR